MNPPSDLLASMGARLSERARRSALARQDYRTVRTEDRVWTAPDQGCQMATLWQGPASRTEVLRLQPGAALPWPDDARAQEILVLNGHLAAHAAGSAVEVILAPQACALRSALEAGSLISTDADTQVYLRQLLADPATLPEPEAQWWRLKRALLQLVPAGARRWYPNFPGVEVTPLWGHAAVTSMLVRFAAGAGVPDHAHAVDEDCLMLAGEMFLGDVLLRPGDYQLAPAGGTHFGELSDGGGTFYCHGAIDPVLVP